MLPLTAAPASAEAVRLRARRILFLRSLVAGGMLALRAISVALSLRLPSLTAENSGFTKKSTRSKYSHPVSVISTTCLLIPLIKIQSPFTEFTLLFLAQKIDFIPEKLHKRCQYIYTTCIFLSFHRIVENRVENVNNST